MRRALSGLLLSALVFATPATTAAAEALLLARPLAMGEAYHAAGAANGAIYFNPAGMSRLTQYVMEWAWIRLPSTENGLHLSIVDTRTQKVGAGVGYTWVSGDETDVHDGRLALSYSPVPGRLFLGTTIRYLFLDNAEGIENVHALAMGLGAVASLGYGVLLGVTAHNALNDTADPRTANRRYGFGVAWEGLFTIEANLGYNPSQEDGGDQLSYHVGGEMLVGEQVPVRLGWSMQPALGNAQYLSGGIGFLNQMAGLELGLRQRLDGDGERAITLSAKTYM